MNDNTLLAIALFAIIILSFKLHCTNEAQKHRDNYISELENENAEIAADRMLVLDSVDALIKRLDQSETEKLNATLWYLQQTRAVKNEMLKRFGKVTIVHDTIEIACLDSNAVDSVNKLAIAYDFEVKDGKIKDTIITHLTTANLQADSLLTNKDKIITAQEKNNKRATKLAKTWRYISYGLAAVTAIILITAK
jgi:hypothetical protein